MVRLNLALDYTVAASFRDTQLRRIEVAKAEILAATREGRTTNITVVTVEQANRGLTDQMIMHAANQRYGGVGCAHCGSPGGMSRAQRRTFARIKEALDREAILVELEDAAFDMLCDLFLGRAAEESVRFPPENALHVEQWTAYLEVVSQARAAEIAAAAAATATTASPASEAPGVNGFAARTS